MRKLKPRKRPHGLRDARLIVIATEGKTERGYFNALASAPQFRNPKVHVEVIQPSDDKSAPNWVLELLDEYSKKYGLKPKEIDELWLVIDVDCWGDDKLSEVARQCVTKGYRLAISNPCFEIWLLLHYRSLGEFSSEELSTLIRERSNLTKELRRICGSYNKRNLNAEHYVPHVETAISHAKECDTNPEQRWTNQPCTRVHVLAKSIITPRHRQSNTK